MNGVGGKKEWQLEEAVWLDAIVKFKAHYGCPDCLYKDEYHDCFLKQKCKVADYPDFGYVKLSDKKECEGCPYSNETGTCFGYCIRAILHEHKIKRSKNGGF